MSTLTVFFSALLVAGSLLATACRAAQSEVVGAAIEDERQCVPIESEFLNKGEFLESEQESKRDAYLSELMFGRLPSGLLPVSVRLVTTTGQGRLLVTLVGETERELRYKLECQHGWYILKKSRTGQYIGDGVVEKQYGQVSMLKVHHDGELMVKVSVEAEFNSMYVFDYNVSLEEQFRFLPLVPE